MEVDFFLCGILVITPGQSEITYTSVFLYLRFFFYILYLITHSALLLYRLCEMWKEAP